MVEAEKAKKIAKKPKKIKFIRRYFMDGEYIVQLNLPNYNLVDLELQQCPTCISIIGSGLEPWICRFLWRLIWGMKVLSGNIQKMEF
jgi:hypothetical protein